MGQPELWKLDAEAFAARRAGLICLHDVSWARVKVRRVPLLRQKLLWPSYKDASFRALRSALVDFGQTRAYGQFWRFLRDELWLDQYVRSGSYRLEYWQPMDGEAQYRLYLAELLLGVMDVKPARLAVIQRSTAAYLMSAYGFTVGRTHLTRLSVETYKYTDVAVLLTKIAS